MYIYTDNVWNTGINPGCVLSSPTPLPPLFYSEKDNLEVKVLCCDIVLLRFLVQEGRVTPSGQPLDTSGQEAGGSSRRRFC